VAGTCPEITEGMLANDREAIGQQLKLLSRWLSVPIGRGRRALTGDGVRCRQGRCSLCGRLASGRARTDGKRRHRARAG